MHGIDINLICCDDGVEKKLLSENENMYRHQGEGKREIINDEINFTL